ncbi:YceI family protein [Apibacter sp. HY039]|uniref:YceI family protein n=1 Tax=Apibacter sp. HY039 TaxID=2501476 RepID=UPI000FEBD84B|nr:YceI family protein [Apibacter sp. HY039]
MKKPLLGFLIILFLFISCSETPKNALPASGKITSAAINLKNYKINLKLSKINWSIYIIKNNLNICHFGWGKFKEGFLNISNTQLKNASLVVDWASLVNESIEKREERTKLLENMKGKEFLDIATYPVSMIKIISSQKIEGVSDYNTQLDMVVELRGIKQTISVKANLREEKQHLYLNTERFTLNFKDFGMSYKGKNEGEWTDNFDWQMSIVADSTQS